MLKYKILYDTSLTYPGFQANKQQTILMADGLSRFCDTTLIVNKLNREKNIILDNYSIKYSNLKIYDLGPLIHIKSIKKNHGRYYPMAKFLLGFGNTNKINILYARNHKQLISWAIARNRYRSLKKWIFVYELHDFNEWHGDYTISKDEEIKDFKHFKKTENYLKMLEEFDLVITASKALHDEIPKYTDDIINPILIEHASALKSVDDFKNKFNKSDTEKIRIGYIGTVDSLRGFENIIESMPYIKSNIHFNLIGHIRKDTFSSKTLNILDEQIRKGRLTVKGIVPINELRYEISKNDYLLLTSSDDLVAKYYCSPLKSYDYMATTKNIISPSAPAYKNIFEMNQISPHYYNHSDKESFLNLINNLSKKNNILKENDNIKTYEERARKILEHITRFSNENNM